MTVKIGDSDERKSNEGPRSSQKAKLERAELRSSLC